jgi:glycosyltransferase involved in cell wall biosynthesis
MRWFLGEVYPLIQAELPEVHLTITGDHANLPLPPAENMVLTGFVEDVRPHLASAWTSLSPIRLGGGTRLKILEAMALRVPVVTTTKGVEGIDARHDEHLLIADTPRDFAQAVLRVLQNPELRQWLGDNGYRFVSEKYDWSVVVPRFMEIAEGVANCR